MSHSIIHVLDENTANKIAAGEVVERPASIVKELAENSLDAGSRNIEIEIAEGGIPFIRVTDDGSGMSREDAKLSVLRHATSKIYEVDDLECISSLGFRGEALPSIAAVSKFSLTTRLHGEELGTYLEIQGGTISDLREGAGQVGTTITIQDLFFNTPARRKFLKTPATEASQIHQVVTKLALSHPDVSFKLINNQKLVLHTPGTNKLRDTLTSLYGTQIAPDLIEIDYADTNISISGMIGKPTLLKGSRQWQTYIVNLRVINSRFIAKAIDNAYHSLLPKTGFPLAVLQITVPLDSVDVNVHPQKSDVKFRDEQQVFRAVYKAVTTTLVNPQQPTQLASPIRPKFIERHPAQPVEGLFGRQPEYKEPVPYQSYQKSNVIYEKPSVSFSAVREAVKRQDEEQKASWQAEATPVLPARAEEPSESFELRVMGQIAECYLIAQGKDGLYIIDQHAAHERILYDKFGQAAERIPFQQLLVPLFFEFSQVEIDVISEQAEVFQQLGFSLDVVGPNTVRLTEAPSDISPAASEALLRQILTEIQGLHNPTAQDLRHACLQIASCKAAIKAGDTLSLEQMQALVNELCATTLPYTCPHGRPVIVRFSPQDMAKMFKRT